jgi:hypothetical protein
MKKRFSAKTHQMKESIADQEKQPDLPADGKWHLVALKAYEFYEQRGCIDGHDLEDWLKAEAIVNGTAG